MATPLKTQVRRTWDSHERRAVWVLAGMTGQDATLNGTPLAFGEVDIYRQVAASVATMNALRASLGLSPIPA